MQHGETPSAAESYREENKARKIDTARNSAVTRVQMALVVTAEKASTDPVTVATVLSATPFAVPAIHRMIICSVRSGRHAREQDAFPTA